VAAAGGESGPDPKTASLYEESYGWFRELALAARPLAHALAAWQRERVRGTMSPAGAHGRGALAGIEWRRSS
jgi:hypothetical protein